MVNYLAGENTISASFPVAAPGTFGFGYSVSYSAFSSTDRTYALNWMFMYAGNPKPSDKIRTATGNFTENDGDGNPQFSESDLITFINQDNKTDYKLINHFQVKYLAAGDGTFVPGSLINSKNNAVYIGTTLDPTGLYTIAGNISLASAVFSYITQKLTGTPYPSNGLFPGRAESNNGNLTSTTTETEQKNEGRPDINALLAFEDLTGQDQGRIWSTITFFSNLSDYSATISPTTFNSLTRSPTPTQFYNGRINTQVYPTYWIYINGKLAGIQIQAANPSALFPNKDNAQ